MCDSTLEIELLMSKFTKLSFEMGKTVFGITSILPSGLLDQYDRQVSENISSTICETRRVLLLRVVVRITSLVSSELLDQYHRRESLRKNIINKRQGKLLLLRATRFSEVSTNC